MRIGAEPFEKQRDDRAQGAVLQSYDGDWPWTIGQPNRQCCEAEALLAEMEDRARDCGHIISHRREVKSQVHGKGGQGDLWLVQAPGLERFLDQIPTPSIFGRKNPR